MQCQICFGSRPTLALGFSNFRICGPCQRELIQLTLPQPASYGERDTIAYFAYEGLVRQLILRAKIYNDDPARNILMALLQTTQAFLLATWADVLIMAPSSLWGRLRGRIDIAAHLAQELHKQTETPVINSPRHLYWRTHKRARSHHDTDHDGDASKMGATNTPQWIRKPIQKYRTLAIQRSQQTWLQHLNKLSHEPHHLLVIDDVVTSGTTLGEVTQSLRDLGLSSLIIRTMAFAKTL